MGKQSLVATVVLAATASIALAATKRDVVFKLDGTLTSGSFNVLNSDGSFISGYFTPSPLPDGTIGYRVGYEWCVQIDVCNYIDGLVPASAVSVQHTATTVNVTPASFVQVFDSQGDPGNFTGTFTPYTSGRYFQSFTTNGNSTQTQVNPDGSTTTVTSSGSIVQQTATFVGVVGPYTIPLLPFFPDGTLGVQKGIFREVTTTP